MSKDCSSSWLGELADEDYKDLSNPGKLFTFSLVLPYFCNKLGVISKNRQLNDWLSIKLCSKIVNRSETVARCMQEGRIGDLKSMQESHKKVGRRFLSRILERSLCVRRMCIYFSGIARCATALMGDVQGVPLTTLALKRLAGISLHGIDFVDKGWWLRGRNSRMGHGENKEYTWSEHKESVNQA